MLLSLSCLLITVSLGHMSMQYPYPRDTKNGVAYAVWQQNEPMISVHPTICHDLDEDTTVRSGNSFAAGDTITIDLYGTASHLGGHCSFWYSTDDITFYKIIDINDCTIADSVSVILPSVLPTACSTKCTFAWTWVPTVSGACEIYMNCADISVSDTVGGDSETGINFQTTFINGADYGCVRVDDSTHWTTIFGDIKTEYSTGTTANGEIEEAEDSVSDTVCYTNPSDVYNLDESVSPDGACGTDSGYRCDDGQCCSQHGFCGPTYYNGGYCDWDNSNSDCDVHYNSSKYAFWVYCNNNAGDWRIDEDCENDGLGYQNVPLFSTFILLFFVGIFSY